MCNVLINKEAFKLIKGFFIYHAQSGCVPFGQFWSQGI